MPKYEVRIEKTTTLVEVADIEIEGDDLDDAKRQANAIGSDVIADDEWVAVSGDCTGWDVVHVKPV